MARTAKRSLVQIQPRPFMVTAKDVNKQCFIKFKVSGRNEYTWENVGARIMGIAKKSGVSKVIIKMPDGERVALDPEDVRVLEPRPA